MIRLYHIIPAKNMPRMTTFARLSAALFAQLAFNSYPLSHHRTSAPLQGLCSAHGGQRAALTVGSVQRMLLEALQRLFIPQFCIEYQVIVPSGQVEANFNAQQAVDPAPHGGNGIL